MANAREQIVVIRTDDGAKYIVETDDIYATSSKFGDRVAHSDRVSEMLDRIAREIRQGLRHTGASAATVEFGLQYSAEGSLAVTLGPTESHFSVKLEFDMRGE